MSVPVSAASGVGGSAPRRLRARVFYWLHRYLWLVLLLVAVVAFVLAYWGAHGSRLTRLNTTVHLLPIGFTGAPPEPSPTAQLQIARILAPLVFASATIGALLAVFRERFQDFRAGFMRGHTVVCGLGDQGQALVESLLGHEKVVGIELDPANLAVRRLRDAGAVVLIGDSSDPEMVRRAHVSRARHVVSVCGQDAVNAQVGANVLDFANRHRSDQLDAFIHVSDPRLYTFLLHHSFSSPGAKLEFFNIYERSVRSLLEDADLFQNAATRSVLVVGAGQLGLELVSHLARDRFTLAARPPDGDKLKIHLVDREASARAQLLVDRYSRLPDVCELVTHQMDAESPAFDHLLSGTELADIDLAFVCFDNDSLTVEATLNILDQAHGRFPVVARVTHRSEGIAGLIEDAQSRYANAAVFRPLSLAQRACRADFVFEGMRGQLARQVHSLYRAGHPGGPYDVPWEDLSPEGRERNFWHAEGIAQQLESVGYRLGPLVDWGEPPPELSTADVERMAELEHERWSQERRRDGWRYGPVRNEEQRTHPDLVPWRDLPDQQRQINRRLVGARPTILAQVGVQIYRD